MRRPKTAHCVLRLAALTLAAAVCTTEPASSQARDPHYVERPAIFSTQSHVSDLSIVQALDLAPGDVISINFGASDHAAFDVFTTSASSFPQAGASYLVLSTGFVAAALSPNDSGRSLMPFAKPRFRR